MLSSVCDNCNPISYEEIEEILKQEYGTNLENIFKFIDHNPVGSASISQVHRAILKNGEEVAIKIKRKDIIKTIDEDIKRIRNIVHRFGKFVNFSNFTGGDHALNLYLDGLSKKPTLFMKKKTLKHIKILQIMLTEELRVLKKLKFQNSMKITVQTI